MWTIEEGIERLRERGAKVTAQRIAMLRQLERRCDHPSAEVLYRELKQDYPTLSIATIYNTAVAYPVGVLFAAAMLALFIHATKKAGVRKAHDPMQS